MIVPGQWIKSRHIKIILFQSEDVLKFACIDFSSQHQKRKKALCIQTDLFLSCPKSKGSCPNTGIVWSRSWWIFHQRYHFRINLNFDVPHRTNMKCWALIWTEVLGYVILLFVWLCYNYVVTRHGQNLKSVCQKPRESIAEIL